jgi:hypothetical protein
MTGQPTSRLLALVAAGVNLVVCGAIVAVVVALRPGGTPDVADTPLGSPPVATVTETVSESPVTTTITTTTAALGEYQQVSGPGGMTTYIPASWPTKVATGPGAMQADDPEGTSRVLRYGGSTTSLTDSYQLHADYERQFAENKSGYVSLRLERTVVRGMVAIDWEFEYDAEEGHRHVRSVYWLAQGYEYFVYASAPVPLWPETQEIFDVMLDNSTP